MNDEEIERLASVTLAQAKKRVANPADSSRAKAASKASTVAATAHLHQKLVSGDLLQHAHLAADRNGILQQSDKVKKENPIEIAKHNGALDTGASMLEEPKSANKKTLGKGWFNLETIPMDDQVKRDIKIITMRNYLDPKRFFKKPDRITKVLGVGTVIEGSAEFTSSRMTKKERRSTILDEVMADSAVKSYTKRKYAEIQSDKANKKRKAPKKRGGGGGSHKGGGSRKKLRAYY